MSSCFTSSVESTVEVGNWSMILQKSPNRIRNPLSSALTVVYTWVDSV